jgi:hypothetical protein
MPVNRVHTVHLTQSGLVIINSSTGNGTLFAIIFMQSVNLATWEGTE